MRRERTGHTLQATALVHEVYLRLTSGQPCPWQNRAHFFAIAARGMREVLVNYAQRHNAVKRGGKEAHRVDIDADLPGVSPKIENVIAIDEALQKLACIDPRQSRLIELRFFAGLSVEEAAEVMDISPVTIKREWRSAKAWLHRELAAGRAE
jgi:RNA polymerase sigma factor (TIGR02999 family)